MRRYTEPILGNDIDDEINRKRKAIREDRRAIVSANRSNSRPPRKLPSSNHRRRSLTKNEKGTKNNILEQDKEKHKAPNRNLNILMRDKKPRNNELYENSNRLVRFAFEHGTLMEVLLVLPLIIMSLYILLIEKGTLVRVG